MCGSCGAPSWISLEISFRIIPGSSVIPLGIPYEILPESHFRIPHEVSSGIPQRDLVILRGVHLGFLQKFTLGFFREFLLRSLYRVQLRFFQKFLLGFLHNVQDSSRSSFQNSSRNSIRNTLKNFLQDSFLLVQELLP